MRSRVEKITTCIVSVHNHICKYNPVLNLKKELLPDSRVRHTWLLKQGYKSQESPSHSSERQRVLSKKIQEVLSRQNMKKWPLAMPAGSTIGDTTSPTHSLSRKYFPLQVHNPTLFKNAAPLHNSFKHPSRSITKSPHGSRK